MRDTARRITLTNARFPILSNSVGAVRANRKFVVRYVPAVNRRINALRDSPRWGRLVSRRIALVTYTGRRSGQVFSLPVGYRRRGNIVIIQVSIPDAKKWWRNFLGQGAPLSLNIGGTEHAGHAVSRRDDRGRVTVTIRLDG